MKKILTLLGALSITSGSAAGVVACGVSNNSTAHDSVKQILEKIKSTNVYISSSDKNNLSDSATLGNVKTGLLYNNEKNGLVAYELNNMSLAYLNKDNAKVGFETATQVQLTIRINNASGSKTIQLRRQYDATYIASTVKDPEVNLEYMTDRSLSPSVQDKISKALYVNNKETGFQESFIPNITYLPLTGPLKLGSNDITMVIKTDLYGAITTSSVRLVIDISGKTSKSIVDDINVTKINVVSGTEADLTQEFTVDAINTALFIGNEGSFSAADFQYFTYSNSDNSIPVGKTTTVTLTVKYEKTNSAEIRLSVTNPSA